MININLPTGKRTHKVIVISKIRFKQYRKLEVKSLAVVVWKLGVLLYFLLSMLILQLRDPRGLFLMIF